MTTPLHHQPDTSLVYELNLELGLIRGELHKLQASLEQLIGRLESCEAVMKDRVKPKPQTIMF